jgi:hypothetical protein
MRADLIPVSDGTWSATIRQLPHDVSHFASYARLCSVLEGGEAKAFVATDGRQTLFVPLILRTVPSHLCNTHPLRDATVPYGYPGPVTSFSRGPTVAAPDEFLHWAMPAMVTRLRQEGVLTVFLRLHPLLSLDLSALSGVGSVVQSGETVAIDLALAEDVLWEQMRVNHRRDIRKACARGDTAVNDPNWSELPTFVRAYRESMDRVNAHQYYKFTDDYFAGLRTALGDHVHLWIARSGSDVTAAALFTECNGIVQYHLGATFNRYLPTNPLKLLFHCAATWFKDRGNRWLHLGGGIGGTHDSLMHFKLGFSPQTFPFYTCRVVLEPKLYDELSERANGLKNGGSSFFPAYREPIVRGQALG